MAGAAKAETTRPARVNALTFIAISLMHPCSGRPELGSEQYRRPSCVARVSVSQCLALYLLFLLAICHGAHGRPGFGRGWSFCTVRIRGAPRVRTANLVVSSATCWAWLRRAGGKGRGVVGASGPVVAGLLGIGA